jgi:hypothetical protein
MLKGSFTKKELRKGTVQEVSSIEDGWSEGGVVVQEKVAHDTQVRVAYEWQTKGWRVGRHPHYCSQAKWSPAVILAFSFCLCDDRVALLRWVVDIAWDARGSRRIEEERNFVRDGGGQNFPKKRAKGSHKGAIETHNPGKRIGQQKGDDHEFIGIVLHQSKEKGLYRAVEIPWWLFWSGSAVVIVLVLVLLVAAS